MIKVVKITNEMKRLRLVNRLKDRGISRMSDGRYVDDLSEKELIKELKKVTLNERII